MAVPFNFKVVNNDILVRFSCSNHKDRIDTAIKNLYRGVDNDSNSKINARFTTNNADIQFFFDEQQAEGHDIRHEAVFFENTDYPLIVRGKGKELDYIKLIINDHELSSKKHSIISNDGELYGSLNFGNQVGLTDFAFEYKVKGQDFSKRLWFTTEVLSYKLDYRTDMKTIISDIEHEYALLSSSFLKDTYLSIRSNPNNGSNPLIWWQIFRSCYNKIIEASRQIIERPKRRLHSVPKYERAERLAFIPRELENEYLANKDIPSHLYRTEEMVLSHDTIENRFLKYVLREIYRMFVNVKSHIMTAMYIDNPKQIDYKIDDIENDLLRLNNNSFFRGVGQFKGFSQDNLVMKQALGYKTIFEKWIELQQGYELEEGMRKLEVKEISDLYEIWCFIKVKNIVQEILISKDENTKAYSNGRLINADFIPQLIYGGEVEFVNHDGIELASVCYNAQVEKEGKTSAISKTNTVTTIQRPDIVLRLSKTKKGIKYTYLFDAKYRIDDKQIDGYDAPPEDAIDQMHRYRDAIYYTGDEPAGKDFKHQYLKKEIIAGYVLFPGLINLEALELPNPDYYYQKSNSLIGIGAFPLRPDQEVHKSDGSVYLKPDSSEIALKNQIEEWLSDDNDEKKLLEESIPQKGLYYNSESPKAHDIVLFGCVRDDAQWQWIKDHEWYNVRLQVYGHERNGGMPPTQKLLSARHFVLYKFTNESIPTVKVLGVYDLQNDDEAPMFFDSTEMKSARIKYPGNVGFFNKYLIYQIDMENPSSFSVETSVLKFMIERMQKEHTMGNDRGIVELRSLYELFSNVITEPEK